jgi:hypothetical protein
LRAAAAERQQTAPTRMRIKKREPYPTLLAQCENPMGKKRTAARLTDRRTSKRSFKTDRIGK